MDCAEIRDAFLAGRVPVDPEFDAHLRVCASCRELVEDEARLGSTLARSLSKAGFPAGLLDIMEQELALEQGPRAWLRSRPSAFRAGLVLSVAAALFVVHFTAARRPDFNLYPEVRWVVVAILLVIGLVLGVDGTLRVLGRPQPKPSVMMGPALSVTMLPLLVAVLPEAEVAHQASLLGAGADFLPRALTCLFYGIVVSGPLVLLLWLSSREDRLPNTSLLFAAGASGIAANLALHAHCPITYPAHLMVGHATVVLAWLLGLGLVNRLLRAR